MLRSLLPRAHQKFLSMPLLGPIIDGFDDWLAANGFTRSSRKHLICKLWYVDADLRRRRFYEIAKLTHPVLHDCWRAFMKSHPNNAGTVRTLELYLIGSGLITDGRKVSATLPASILAEEYANHLREVCGFVASTASHHRWTVQCFLRHLEDEAVMLRSVQPGNIESYIAKTGKHLSRAALQHDIAAVRGFLRFLAMDGRVTSGLDRQIDTPRLYRLEQLPRALPWETVKTLLQSIDTVSAIGLRDYAMFLLIATYGLRSRQRRTKRYSGTPSSRAVVQASSAAAQPYFLTSESTPRMRRTPSSACRWWMTSQRAPMLGPALRARASSCWM